MTIKLVVGECTLNVVSAYAPQVGLDEEIKKRFWEGLDDIIRSIPPSERLFVGGDFNSHIGSSTVGYTEVHGGYDIGERNGGGTSLLDFVKAFDLVIANSSFPKRDEHLAAREVLGISSGRTGGHKGDWWWNAVVQDKVETKKAAYLRFVGSSGEEEKRANNKVEAKKAAYLRFVGSSGEEERRANNERYKVARREAKMAVIEAKTATFARL
uniref:Craniofacial development protein 2-like n=1 Tax=Nicotiana tabacum TaxID=4097 RepID=A0A1S4CRL2_TOBAC